MKSLVVEDDFVSRKLLHTFLSPYGECDVAVNGKEAIEAFLTAWKELKPYNLICLDIMMPEMDGQEALKQIRYIENEMDIPINESVKIIMTTALGDKANILEALRSQCEAYLIKPLTREKIIGEMKRIGLME